MNKTKEKILLLLLGGIDFGFSWKPGQRWRVLKTISREWKKIKQKELTRGINDLHRFNFINKSVDKDGFCNVVLTEKGKLRALNFQLDDIKNKKEKWDGKWRMVAFDVPEKYKKGRDALRNRLKNIGFRELQKSVFVTPIKCEKEMRSFIDFFRLGSYVRLGVLDFIDNEIILKKVFKINP